MCIRDRNIGTCITAMLSSIGATKNAKRAAIVHLYFNIVGTVTFMVVFYVLNGFLHFSFIEEVAGPAGIAVIHSAFNIIATLVFLPFGDMLEMCIRDSSFPYRFHRSRRMAFR